MELENFVGKKVLMVLAHPDDELIFGWPILQQKSIQKEILMCSSDLRNKERTWCSHRKYSLISLCADLDIPVTILDYNSQFYKTDARSGDLANLCKNIMTRISAIPHTHIFTHNPLGEYGNMDHILVHSIVLNSAEEKTPVLFTDIFQQNVWSYTIDITHKYRKLYYRNFIGKEELDMEFFNRYKAFYFKKGVWTWNNPPITSCKMYLL